MTEREFLDTFYGKDCFLKSHMVQEYDNGKDGPEGYYREYELYFVINHNKNIVGYAMSERQRGKTKDCFWTDKKFHTTTLDKWNHFRHQLEDWNQLVRGKK